MDSIEEIPPILPVALVSSTSIVVWFPEIGLKLAGDEGDIGSLNQFLLIV